MVDDLKKLLESPIQDGVEEIRERFDALFGELPREERVHVMLLLSVSYVLNEKAATQIEAAAKRGQKPGLGAMSRIMSTAMMDFATAIRAIVAAGLEATQERRDKKGD